MSFICENVPFTKAQSQHICVYFSKVHFESTGIHEVCAKGHAMLHHGQAPCFQSGWFTCVVWNFRTRRMPVSQRPKRRVTDFAFHTKGPEHAVAPCLCVRHKVCSRISMPDTRRCQGKCQQHKADEDSVHIASRLAKRREP